eukprot:TRINITY_DN12276_c0_g1_i5.p2 TRINITY_DN12276_c0_g1~~TRINITY_DN12276_c0_g1_i5.p2  ORF type:complete len:131 (+),score=56.05 TRINITY_DN12276_c0_g1_i5:111-503(+)
MRTYRVFFFFFFQAEDGIRDAQESRGLGDVYKRQECANVAEGSKCPLAASQKVATQALVAGVAVTVLAQYFATKIVLHNKTPTEVAQANNASKEACHSGDATCYRIPPCLLAISVLACAVPTAVLAICKK